MIVNFKEIPYAIIELDKKDMEKLKNGQDIIKESYSAQDKPILVRAYCSQPDCFGDDHD